MAKHTAGPWKVATFTDDRVRDTEGIFAGSLPVVHPYMGICGRSVAEAEANAFVLAAAPDMLEALEGCADALREAGKDFAIASPLADRPNLYELHERVARSAIAEARGEG